jgi:hypothetical protein
MKFTKLYLISGLLVSSTAISSTFSKGDALHYLYDIYFGDTPSILSNVSWPIDGGWGAPQYPNQFTFYRDETPTYVESGRYLNEPKINLSGVLRTWSDEHATR